MSVMPVKIKSILSRPSQASPHQDDRPLSPNPCDASRHSFGSALKNLSQERCKKKISKLKDSADKCQINNQGLLQSLTSLQQQYENMKSQKSYRSSIKKPVMLKGVPHTSITLNQRPLQLFSNDQSCANSTLHSRNNSLSNKDQSLRVVTIGTQCQRRRKPTKKKGIHISLLQNRSIKLF